MEQVGVAGWAAAGRVLGGWLWAEGSHNAYGCRAVNAALACNLPAAGAHFLKWGCWWNRDIEQIVRQAGLEIDSMSRWHFGTTYLVVARPPAEALLQ